MQPNPGDKVEIKTKEKLMHGTLMPEHADTLVLKLNSGYNLGIDKKNVLSIKVIESKKDKKIAEKNKTNKTSEDKTLCKISILHTGGTIASKIDYETGGVIARFSPEELTAMFPEIRSIANITSRLIRNMWSEDLRFAHFNILAEEIEKEIKDGANGIIITHGTDFLHYTSAALSFALENLSIPVILVGAQRSSDRPSSDAAYNVISAAYFIANSTTANNQSPKWHGVGICMHENQDDDWCNILPGLKTRKMHTSRRDAFKAINASSVARINFKQKKIEFSAKNPQSESSNSGKLLLKLFNEKLRIGLVKSHPQMFPEEISAYKDFDGVILEGSGLGQFPGEDLDEFTKMHPKILEEIGSLAKKMPVAMTSQTIYGRINMNVYSKGRNILDLGVLGNMCDMTPETAFIKLAWLLSNHPKDLKTIRELYGKNLRGEISDRTENDFNTF